MVLRLNKDPFSEHTERYKNSGLPPEFLEDMAKIVEALEAAGFAPYDQLMGYVRTGNERYITRDGGARELIRKMDIRHIKIYLKHCKDRK